MCFEPETKPKIFFLQIHPEIEEFSSEKFTSEKFLSNWSYSSHSRTIFFRVIGYQILMLDRLLATLFGLLRIRGDNCISHVAW